MYRLCGMLPAVLHPCLFWKNSPCNFMQKTKTLYSSISGMSMYSGVACSLKFHTHAKVKVAGEERRRHRPYVSEVRDRERESARCNTTWLQIVIALPVRWRSCTGSTVRSCYSPFKSTGFGSALSFACLLKMWRRLEVPINGKHGFGRFASGTVPHPMTSYYGVVVMVISVRNLCSPNWLSG
jgi:hypothetical protein